MEYASHVKFKIKEKSVDVYPSAGTNRPVVYLNSFSSKYEELLTELKRLNCPDFSLVVISGLEWDHDMTPWYAPPIAPDDSPCTGGADEYLDFFINEIMPKAEKKIGEVGSRCVAGYSLAGLFAIYSMYRTDIFSCVCSMSGSLWFPEFKEYALTHELKRPPRHIYLSLGAKESKTDNPFLKPVRANTQELANYYKSLMIDVKFKLNPGNHFTEPFLRSAMGVAWAAEKMSL